MIPVQRRSVTDSLRITCSKRRKGSQESVSTKAIAVHNNYYKKFKHAILLSEAYSMVHKRTAPGSARSSDEVPTLS
jgi:hypothetical protein